MTALKGIRVLDFSTSGPGNFATMILGDLGADVILIAPPEASDVRVSATSYAEGEGGEAYQWSMGNVLSVLSESLNRNKRSMTLNLKTTEGRNIFYELAKSVDVILDGFRPGVTERLGVDYQTIKKMNPRIIYCSMSGYGYDGPYRDLPGHDINYLALAGALDMIGQLNGPPVIPMNIVGDWCTSLHAVIGILAALAERQKGGNGQFVEISYLESVLSVLTPFHYDYLNNGTIYKRGETFYNGRNPFYNVYPTKDGKYITIGCNEPGFWQNLCRVLGREDFIPYQYAQDEKKEEITSWLRETFLTKNRDEWFDFLKDKNIPIGKVYSSDEVFKDPHIVSREMVIEMNHPIKGKIKHVGSPFKLSDTPAKITGPAPRLGQHTEEIFTEILKYTPKDLVRLREQNII